MHIRPVALVVAATSMTVGGITVSHAASSQKKSIDKITCQEFVALQETYQPMYVAWAWGYNYGQTDPSAAWVDMDGIEDVTPTLVAECQQDPQATFWSKVKSKFRK